MAHQGGVGDRGGRSRGSCRLRHFFDPLEEPKGRSTSIVLVAFYFLYLNGRDLRKLPLLQRKTEPKKIDGTGIQFSESFELEVREVLEHACKIELRALSPKPATAGTPAAVAATGSRDLHAVGDSGDRRLRARRRQVGWYLGRRKATT